MLRLPAVTQTLLLSLKHAQLPVLGSTRMYCDLRELHYLLDKVVSVGTAPGPNSSDHNVNTITMVMGYFTQSVSSTDSNSQAKDNKIDLLFQQYEQFTILEEESIDSDFARFNTIITSLKALDEGFSSKNYVRKYLRAVHPKWTTKVTTIEELKDLSSLALDELISNLKVHEVVMEKDFEIYRGKKERIKSIALKAKKESSDDETSTSGGNQEKKRSHSDKGMRGKGRVTENALDAVIHIISLAIVQNHLATKIKRHSLEVLGAIAKMTSKTKLTKLKRGFNFISRWGNDPGDHISWLESNRILLAIACANDFKLYQMNVKSAFLNGFINEEVYVAQPSTFEEKDDVDEWLNAKITKRMSMLAVENMKDALISIIKSIRHEIEDGIMKRQIDASTTSVSDEVSSIASNEVDRADDNTPNIAPCRLTKELSP
ncbi:DUF4219 domain-containing protein [Tanacetum coccineum]